jgi:hypothetical protein
MAALIFGIASFLAGIASFMSFMESKSAVHQILGATLGLVSAIFGVGCVVVYQLANLPDRLAHAMSTEATRRIEPPPSHVDLVPATTEPAAPPPKEPALPREPRLAWALFLVVSALIIGVAIVYVWQHRTAN